MRNIHYTYPGIDIPYVLILFMIMLFFLQSCNSKEDNVNYVKYETCRVDIDCSSSIGEIPAIWDGIGGAYLTWGLHDRYPDLKTINNDGFNYLRFQETIYTIYKENDQEGNPVYDWSKFDKVIDHAVNSGFKLLLVLESTPDIIAGRPPKPDFSWCNRYPPSDFNRWYQFIYDVVNHCQERYGKEVVESWYWEVWNEPWASKYFYGSKAEYFKLHDYTVTAIKDVNPNLKVGGNLHFASDEADDSCEICWLEELLEHSLTGINASTAEKGTPLDFISFHHYPLHPGQRLMDISFDGFIEKTFRRINEIKSEHGLENLPVLMSEWNITSMTSDLRDGALNAAYTTRAYHFFLDNNVERLFFQSLVDYPYNEFDGFSGRGGLFTTTGIQKPVYNALVLMQRLFNERLRFVSYDERINGIASISENKANFIITNCCPNLVCLNDIKVDLNLLNIKKIFNELQYKIYRIDDSHANSYSEWLSMGAKDNLSYYEILKITEAGDLKVVEENNDLIQKNMWIKEIIMPSNSIIFLEIEFD